MADTNDLQEITLGICRKHPDAKIPTLGSEFAACLDLHALLHGFIPSNTTAPIRTGIAIELPEGCVGLIKPRSKLALNNGLDIRAGVIDEDYRGELIMLIRNESDVDFEYAAGDKLAQLLVQPHFSFIPIEVKLSLSETTRSDAGINSVDQRLS